MASSSMENITHAMNNVLLDDEEEGGIAIVDGDEGGMQDEFSIGNARLCLIGRFLTEGVLDFSAMKQTLAALWRPGRGVYIKEINVNLFLFQFYHEIDIKRVIDGSPWTFNRKVLLITRLQEGVNPRCVSINNLDLWVQIHDLQPGFMSEKVNEEIGNQVGKFVSSCPSNFKGLWREYMRIRVTLDINKPLKRRMKIRKSGNEWIWITFKYENVPTFCFICGLMGHSDKFCSRIFDTPENEITRPYGTWMRAPFKRQTKMIGAKWLRNGEEDASGKESAGGNTGSGEKSTPKNQEMGTVGVKDGDTIIQNMAGGELSGNLKTQSAQVGGNIFTNSKRVTILKNKKRRTEAGFENPMDLNTELCLDSDGEDNISMDQDANVVSKNLFGAGSGERARQSS